MREIKFRMWDKERKEMKFLPYIYFGSDGEIAFIPSKDWSYIDDYPRNGGKDIFSVMQFTGLFDKNGKEIYEGDVVIEHSTIPTTLENPSGKVLYYKDYCGFVFQYYSDVYKQWYVRRLEGEMAKKYEVIGNIYENPELLK